MRNNKRFESFEMFKCKLFNDSLLFDFIEEINCRAVCTVTPLSEDC